MKILSVAHRICKEVVSWQKIVGLAVKVMLGLKKYDSLKIFLTKVMATTSELVEEVTKEGKKDSSFKIELK